MDEIYFKVTRTVIFILALLSPLFYIGTDQISVFDIWKLKEYFAIIVDITEQNQLYFSKLSILENLKDLLLILCFVTIPLSFKLRKITLLASFSLIALGVVYILYYKMIYNFLMFDKYGVIWDHPNPKKLLPYFNLGYTPHLLIISGILFFISHLKIRERVKHHR
ncbi:MAG: hypothetical protein H0Z28_09825 [Archaeoglobus sp.]|nr:hypothetical protein [Archaeoglobus sp.]